MGNTVEIAALRKVYGSGSPAVDGLSFSIREGEIVSLLGPSGCGKTTTLRCIAGLETPDRGEITIRGRTVVQIEPGRRHVVPAEDRGVSMVFQNYALWPHMTVWENVAFGVRLRTKSKSGVEQAATRALQMVKLERLKDRNISQLSGGQQQRVALARALAFQPPLVLFDEPLSNLDARLRDEMRFELLQLQRDLGFSALYVTHDQQEATGLSSRVIIMNDGKVEQEGTPQEVWANPSSSFVAEFLGNANRIDGVLKGTDPPGTRILHSNFGPTLRIAAGTLVPDDSPASAYVSFHHVELSSDPQDPRDAAWHRGRIKLISFTGHGFLVRVSFGLGDLVARADDVTGMSEGQEVFLRIPAERVRCFAVGRLDATPTAELAVTATAEKEVAG